MSRAINYIPCLSTAGEVLKPIKLFVVLIQTNLHTKFPGSWLNRDIGLLCKLSAVSALLLLKSHWAAHKFSPVLIRWGQKTLHSKWCYASASFPGMGEKVIQATLNFPNMLSSWEWVVATLSLGYKLTSLLYIEKTSMPYNDFALGNQFCPHTYGLECHWAK